MSQNTKLWHLENFKLFKELSGEMMMELEQKTSMKSAKKNEYIYFPDEPSTSVFFLKKGRIKIGSYSSEGKENTHTILEGGNVFGELAIAGEEKRKDFAQALDDDVLICAMSHEDLEKMMEKNPGLGIKITKIIGFRLQKTERRLNDLIFKDARTRIIDFIKDLATETGKKIGVEILIKHHLTHQDMANLTATSRQTVTTILNELREDDLIYMERKKILIRNIDQIK